MDSLEEAGYPVTGNIAEDIPAAALRSACSDFLAGLRTNELVECVRYSVTQNPLTIPSLKSNYTSSGNDIQNWAVRLCKSAEQTVLEAVDDCALYSITVAGAVLACYQLPV